MRTVTGTWATPAGPAAGTVVLHLDGPLVNTATNVVVMPAPVSAELVAGAISVELQETDAAGVLPGTLYWVTERITGAPARTYRIAVPVGTGPLDLADAYAASLPAPSPLTVVDGGTL